MSTPNSSRTIFISLIMVIYNKHTLVLYSKCNEECIVFSMMCVSLFLMYVITSFYGNNGPKVSFTISINIYEYY